MAENHPSSSDLRMFLRGEAPEGVSAGIVRHLASGCAACSGVARAESAIFSRGETDPSRDTEVQGSSADYAEVFRRIAPKIWQVEQGAINERQVSLELKRELDRHPPQRRMLLVKNSRKYHLWALCEFIIDEGFELCSKEPLRALEAADTAIAVAHRLDESKYSRELCNDIRGRAYCLLGNARRITSDLRGAGEAFSRSETLLKDGSGDPLESARLSRLRAILSAEYRDFGKAIALLDKAIAIYKRAGERHLEGRTLLSKAAQLGHSGDYRAALPLLDCSYELLDHEREPRLELAIQHNRLLFSFEAGLLHKATALLPSVRALYDRMGSEMDLIRFRWLEGKIASRNGDFIAAREAFAQCADDFAKQGARYDSALVSLDLAMVLLRQGSTSELKELAVEMLAIFRALEVERETIAALVLLTKAIEMERASVLLVQDVVACLELSRTKAKLAKN